MGGLITPRESRFGEEMEQFRKYVRLVSVLLSRGRAMMCAVRVVFLDPTTTRGGRAGKHWQHVTRINTNEQAEK